MANAIVFVLLSLGSLVFLGFLNSAFPALQHVVMSIGEHGITGANLIFVGLACFVVWASAQV